MSFMTADIVRFARQKQVPQQDIAAIERRAREATQDYGGADGEFAHSKLAYVLGRDLADEYRAAVGAPA
jgi:hypothetical protein